MRGSRSLLHDLGVLAGAQVAAQLLNLAALVVLARRLGDHQFGLVQVGVAVSAYAMIAAEWGLFSLGIRDVARLKEPHEALAYARAHQGLLAALALVVAALGMTVLPAFPFFREDPALFRLYLLMVVPQVAALEWLATGLQRMKAAGLAKVVASAVYAGLVVFALPVLDGKGGWPSQRWVPALYFISFAAGAAAVAPVARRWLGGWVRPTRVSGAVWRARLGESAPLGGSLVLMRVLISSDLILLGILAVPATAGVYAAAARIGFLVVVAMEVLWKALLPRLSRLAAAPGGENAPEFRRSVRSLFLRVLAALLPIAALAAAWAPQVMALLYGGRYATGASVLRVLMASYVLLSLGWLAGGLLLVVGRQREALAPQALAAVVTVASHMLLIPRWGAVGAAWAMLAGHATLALAMAVVCRGWFGRGRSR